MSFLELSSELTGRVAGLSPVLADRFVNRAWADIRGKRLWSFLQEDCGIFCPPQVTTGTVAFTQFDDEVTLNAAASAAFLAVSLPAPLTQTALQIRFGATNQTGQVYSISAFDDSTPAAVVLTLNRLIMEATNATSEWQLYRAYIKPTVDDFLKWESLVDMTNGFTMTDQNGRLSRSSTYFDLKDPQRQAQGLAYYLGAFKGNSELQPRPTYELWPHPTNGQTFYGRFRRHGEDFSSAADTQPVLIPDALIIERALGYHVYPWVAENIGHFPALRGTPLGNLMLESKKAFKEMLLDAKRQDDEQQMSSVWARGHGLITGRTWNHPIDANWIQSHLVNL